MVGTGPLEAHSGHSKEHSNLEGETMGDPKMGPLTPPHTPTKCTKEEIKLTKQKMKVKKQQWEKKSNDT